MQTVYAVLLYERGLSLRSIDRSDNGTATTFQRRENSFFVDAKRARRRAPLVSCPFCKRVPVNRCYRMVSQPGANPADLCREPVQHPRGAFYALRLGSAAIHARRARVFIRAHVRGTVACTVSVFFSSRLRRRSCLGEKIRVPRPSTPLLLLHHHRVADARVTCRGV